MAGTGNKNLLIIFTKNLEPGKVKTRLAETLGNEKAMEVHKELVKKIHQITLFLPFDKTVFYSDKIADGDIWNDDKYHKKVQEGNDIGERMMNAFQNSFDEGYEKVCLIGTDCYQLTSSIIMDSFRKLKDKEMVIGPAKDGGYYLIAMKSMYNIIFKNKSWGTAEVLKETLKDIENHGINNDFVTELNDIDTEEDLKQSANSLYKKLIS